MKTVPSTLNKCRDLFRQSQDPCNDIQVSIKKTGDNSFAVDYFTCIKSGAQYLLILSTRPDAVPISPLVAGRALYSCAAAAGLGMSIEDGVRAYLKQYGSYVDVESLHVEIHKLSSNPIAEFDYQSK